MYSVCTSNLSAWTLLQLASAASPGYALGTSIPYTSPTHRHLLPQSTSQPLLSQCGLRLAQLKSWAPTRNRHLNMHADARIDHSGSPPPHLPMSPQGNRYWPPGARLLARAPVGALIHRFPYKHDTRPGPIRGTTRGGGRRESVPGCLPASICPIRPIHGDVNLCASKKKRLTLCLRGMSRVIN